MRGIPEATVIILMAEERAELEGLARSTKTEHRLRQRARIVLLAADGVASRAIGRAVGCTTGTASKWRVRYAAKRLAGLDETGERGAEPKYTTATNKRILALEAIEARGAMLRYLPKYSPDLNPIEMPFSKLKAYLRKAAERTIPRLRRRIGRFARTLTTREASNYFRHAGYA